MPSRVLLIGWDGADWRILDPLLERGLLPNLATLIARGGRATLTSTIPRIGTRNHNRAPCDPAGFGHAYSEKLALGSSRSGAETPGRE